LLAPLPREQFPNCLVLKYGGKKAPKTVQNCEKSAQNAQKTQIFVHFFVICCRFSVNPQCPECGFDLLNPLFAPNPPENFPQNSRNPDFSVLNSADIYCFFSVSIRLSADKY
jgi:hypothetical protein